VAQPFVVALRPHQPILLRPIFYSARIAWPALVIAATCFVLTRFCWKKMGRNWRMGIDPAERNPLLANGPYGIVRHPIYALSIIMMLATLAMIPTPLMLAAGAIHITFLVWEARREEIHMINMHGQRYAEYCAQVGGFIPRPSASA
jgi:protein-S-isoprenylcysteine O-methyltransferase Ste14